MSYERFKFIDSIETNFGKGFLETISTDEYFEKEIIEFERKNGLINLKEWMSISNRYKDSENIYEEYQNERLFWMRNFNELKSVFKSASIICNLKAYDNFAFKNKVLKEPLYKKIEHHSKIEKTKERLFFYFAALIFAAFLFLIFSIKYVFFWYNYAVAMALAFFGVELFLKSKDKTKSVRVRNRIIKEIATYKLSIKEAENVFDAINLLDDNDWIFDRFKYSVIISNDNIGHTKLLNKANEVIRAANLRISSLKEELVQHKLTLNEKNELISKLKSDLSNLHTPLQKHEVFGLASDCLDKRIIKIRYKQLSNIYHPDKSKSDKFMKTINNAYDEYTYLFK